MPSNYKQHKKDDINDMMNRIRHVNILRGIRIQPDTFLLELSKENPSGIPILITPYCNGGNLRHQLNDDRNVCGMCETEVRNILISLKNAISYLHSLSIVHRDLKPESVVIELTADGQRNYKLTDSGNSEPLDIQNIEMLKNIAYAAPELITNATVKHGPAVDYWSIGMIAYEISTGVRPFVPHLPLAQWVLRVREKKSEHISIYETNDGEMIYTNRVWSANQLTNAFANGLEHWLQLALEWNPKQRGYIFEKIQRNPSERQDSQANDNHMHQPLHGPPVQVLKFFDAIDDVLSQKLLTIFTLSNHKLISMEVTERTTMADLYAFIEQKALIPATKGHIIIQSKPYTDTNDDEKNLSNCNEHDKPIDFYREDCVDQPMIFVTQIKSSLPTTNSHCSNDNAAENIFPTDIPITVQGVLKNPENSLKLHSLRRFSRDALHFVRTENHKFKTSLDGWLTFAKQLSRDIEKCQLHVRQMQSSIYGLSGALDIFKTTMQMAADKQSLSSAHEFSSVTKITQNLECLENACDKIALRHISLHRRCREICQHELFAKRNVQDFYDIINLTKAYATLNDQITRNKMPPRPHFELFQCTFKCLKQRDSLLRSTAFCDIKRNLLCIHTELIEIRKALEKAIAPAERYRCDLLECNRKLHENAWHAKVNGPTTVSVATATNDEKLLATVDIATSTTNLIHLTTNGTNPNDCCTSTDQDQSVNNFELIEHLRSLRNDSERHVMQTKSIIEDNINLRISMADVMTEINDELRQSSI